MSQDIVDTLTEGVSQWAWDGTSWTRSHSRAAVQWSWREATTSQGPGSMSCSFRPTRESSSPSTASASSLPHQEEVRCTTVPRASSAPHLGDELDEGSRRGSALLAAAGQLGAA